MNAPSKPSNRTRLNVVLFQPSRNTLAGPKASPNPPSAFTEVVVGHLAGRPGLDLLLMGTLEKLVPESTETLAMQSINGELVVLAWDSADSILDALARVSVLGYRARHLGDPNAPGLSVPASNPNALDANGQSTNIPVPRSSTPRPIYLIDLATCQSIDALVELLENLRASKSVSVVGLTTPSVGLSQTAPTRNHPGPLPPPLDSLPMEGAEANVSLVTTCDARLKTPSVPPPANQHKAEGMDPNRGQLDGWIDELDAFDL